MTAKDCITLKPFIVIRDKWMVTTAALFNSRLFKMSADKYMPQTGSEVVNKSVIHPEVIVDIALQGQK